MLTHNQEKFLQSLYKMEQYAISNIKHAESNLEKYEAELQHIMSAIANLEAERNSI